MIDINNFKDINDTRGHKIGDKVLRQVAYVLQKSIRASDKAYRLGGDEFIIIFSHHKTRTFVTRIKDALADLNLTISTGYCNISDKKCMEQIDKRMYEEKRK
jgi:diguanylate cyclase (GGDEF)-like protein